MFAWLTQFSSDPLITYHDHVGGEHQRDDGDGWIAMQMTKISYGENLQYLAYCQL